MTGIALPLPLAYFRLLRAPMFWLLACVPIAEWLDRVPNVPAAARFGVAALAIVPLSSLMVLATEQLALRIGAAAGALLNATFGNAPELIISLIALNAGLNEVVKASIVGVVLGNLLFVLGLAFLIGGLGHREQRFNRRGARNQRSVLMVAAISITVPSVFDSVVSPETANQELALNTGVAVVLLTTYALSLVFMLKTHPEYFVPKVQETSPGGSAPWPPSLCIAALLGASVVLGLMSEILVGAVDQTAAALHLSKAFIGVIILSLIGGAPESVAAVSLARKNKLDLSMGIAVGSSIQIALFVAPVLMLASRYIADRPFDLVVGNAGVMIVLLPVLIFSMIVMDGKSNWFKGVQLLSVYLLIAMFCYFLPDVHSVPLWN